ncbi:MAG: hypothetical protein ACYC5O_19295 [Anaerolineae bacterium]
MSPSERDALTPCLPDRLPRLGRRLRDGQDLSVVLWGDSLLAREQHTTPGSIDPRALPPMMHTRRLDWYLWQALPLSRPTYRRFDYLDAFRFGGAWQAVAADPSWDDAPYRPGITYVNASSDASFGWALGPTPAGSVCNLLYRTEATGAEAIVSVDGGPGRAQVYDEEAAAWQEAHGYIFTQRRLAASLPRRQGNTLYPRRLAFRSRQPGNEVRVAVAKVGGDGGRLLLWGTESLVPGSGVLTLHNAARGSHTLAMLAVTMDDEVIAHRPDLVLLELPLLNMVHVCPTIDYAVNWVWDVVWGDRNGAENDWALARRAGSPAWSGGELLLLIPHHSQVHVAEDGAFADLGGVTAAAIYNGVRDLIAHKGNVPAIDMASAFRRCTATDQRFANYWQAMAPSAPDGRTYTTDGVHQNDRGTLIYAREICSALGLPLPAEPQP